MAPSVFPAHVADFQEQNPSFYGSVFDFGIRNCFQAENDHFWRRKWGRSVYRASAHSVRADWRINKTKGQIIKMWVLGLLGILGLHYFSVGRFMTGALRFLYGALMCITGIIVSFAPQAVQGVNPLRIMLVFLVFALIPSVVELIIICMGKFRDVFRSHIT